MNGPAHTINVQLIGNPKIKFSMDLVLAMVFDDERWIATRKRPSNSRLYRWNAIPKPFKDDTNDDLSWITSYAEFEREYIKNLYHLKPLIRLFKVL